MSQHDQEAAPQPSSCNLAGMNPVAISVAWWLACARAGAAWGLSYPID